MSPWTQINPPSLADPVGYANAVVSEGGRRVTLAGQTAMDETGAIVCRGDIVGQADRAFRNLLTVLEAAGGEPTHLVRMRIYVVDVAAWREKSGQIGKVYQKYFGRWYPAMTLVQVVRLYDTGALVEVESDAVVPTS
jgi:enamine deaminase RidA (YjgF/YER057c/UK114 family)